MSISVSGSAGVVGAMLQPAGGGAGGGAPAGPAVDFGPAATFTSSVFSQALQLSLYNRSGAQVSVALTQYLNNGSLPAPGSTEG